MSENQGTSTLAVLTALSANAITFGAFMGAFILFRVKFKRIYAPKSSFDLVPEDKKPDPLPLDPLRWIFILLRKPPSFFIQQCGLDGYLFLRYLIVMGLTFAIGILIWVVLLPINAVGGRGNGGLDRLSISNVKDPHRYYAHAFMSWVFYGGVIFVIYRELYFYNSLRTAVMTSPLYASKLSSRTVLFQSVPDSWLDEKQFFKLFNGVKRIYVTRNVRKLVLKVNKRQALAMQLEAATTKLLKTGIKNKSKADKKANKEKKYKNKTLEVDDTAKLIQEFELLDATVKGIDHWVPEEKRPRQREGGLFSKKIDTIEYCRKELKTLDDEIYTLQKRYRKFHPKNSIFVEFEDQYSAEIAHQCVLNHSPFTMTPSYIGVEPSDIDWMNMRLFWWEKIVRNVIAIAVVCVLVIFWATPVAFVGMISNINYITEKIHFLSFIKKTPKWLLGFITGLLPTVLLALLLTLLPMFIRAMAKTAGAPSYQERERFTHNAYFFFLFVNSFLITALASSAVATIQSIIDNPASVLSILADNLPKSSNFYISYLLLQAFTIAGGSLLQVVGLVLYFVLGAAFDTTLRKKWDRFSVLGSLDWGTTFPIFINLVCISLAFSIIAPMILLFAAAAMLLSYIAYAHNLSFVFVESPNCRGRHYSKALFQTFTGLYTGQVCLLGLFIVGKGYGPIVLQAIGLGFTAFAHIQLKRAFGRQIEYTPLDAMRALDGVSTTHSFSGHSEYLRKILGFKENFASQDFIDREKLVHAATRQEIDEKLHPEDSTSVAVPLMADRDFKKTKHNNFIVRFLRPDVYMSFLRVKELLPKFYYDVTPYEDDKTAYFQPVSAAKMPVLWIPQDPYGWSTQEIEKNKRVLKMYDTNSGFNSKGGIEFLGPPPY
ncbi:hypothetical protein PUMCH_003893 [Australozyma saopauloensis]|uniref:DUF221-domain-containing protein n=1 Tax=Australozyma saopauloensis TaxID=291208 RepID=A0AAX4HDT1_9ASCO|nr:hypothetical protein PUMCH_003893 [[Candida] saopauloensis]